MEILFVLIPLSIVIVTVAVLVFRWAVNSGQYDDLDGPAHSILFEDDQHMIPKNEQANSKIKDKIEVKRHPKC